MYGKKLAYIVKVGEIRNIPGADRIELASVMDYTVVVKKNEYKPGDLAMYVEVDSVLPDGLSPELKVKYDSIKDGTALGETATEEEVKAALAAVQAQSKFPYFEFLRDKKFKIKSMKLSKFGVISQGILFKPSDIGLDKVKEGQDYTAKFEITEAIQDEEEAGVVGGEKDNWFVRKLMRFSWFRNLRKAHQIVEGWDATFPGKSDEENVQKLYKRMYEQYADKEWVATEKLEGQNISIFSEMVMKPTFLGLFRKKEVKDIGVCSRTRRLRPNGTGKNFWDTVKRLGLDEKIKNIPGEWWCRGEHCGPNIQGNIYKLPQTQVIFFDFYRKEKYLDVKNGKKMKSRWVKLNYEDSKLFAEQWGLPFVPVLDEHYKLPAGTVNEQGVEVSGADIMLQQSDKNTVFGNNLKHKREGFVLRLRDDYNVSFKVKNPNYSI
jgi:hypothetical protein